MTLARSARFCTLAAGLALAPGCRLFRGASDGPVVEPSSAARGAPAEQLPGALLGASDLIEVRVFQEPDFSGTHRIGPDGAIDFPLCGRVVVGGKNAGDAADTLAACLRGRFLKSPQVSVLLREANSRKVFVVGEVAKPGSFLFEDGMSVVHALALAGGFTRLAARNGCTITRMVDGVETRLVVRVDDIAAGRAATFLLHPGDVLYVPESVF